MRYPGNKYKTLIKCPCMEKRHGLLHFISQFSDTLRDFAACCN